MPLDDTILLFGGASEERLVSFASAQNIATALDSAKFWFMNPDSEIFSIAKAELLSHKNPFLEQFVPKSAALAKNLEEAISQFQSTSPVFFFGLHGGEGENGKLQALLEKKKIPFTGSGSEASRKAFDKDITREEAKKNKALVADGVGFTVDGTKETLLGFLEKRFEQYGPQVLKPVDGGSSFGLFFLREKSELEDTVLSLKTYEKRKYLAESLIEGREMTVGVMRQGNKIIALPPSEVVTDKGRSFDYEGKYLGKGTKEITPANITKEETEVCQKLAVQMHEALGCYGYTRTDMILTPKGPYYLETNTLPGLTKASFFPQQLEAAKISFKTFIDNQLELARKRY